MTPSLSVLSPASPFSFKLPSSPDAELSIITFDTDDITPFPVNRQWTGAPIRAILPLPRTRCRPTPSSPSNQPRSTRLGPDATTQMDMEMGPDDVVEDEVVEDTRVGCSYESITAADGLSAWSFEELRVECYAQSLIARGTKPPPVVQPSLAIPPAFAPWVVHRRVECSPKE